MARIVEEVLDEVPLVESRDDDLLRAARSECFRHLLQRPIRDDAVLGIRDIEQLARLCEVRRDEVRHAEQAAHLVAHLLRVRRVELAVVAHDRVHHDARLRPLEAMDEVEHDGDLLGRAQKARTDAIECQAIHFPALDVRLHARRIIIKVMIREARVDRKDGGRQGACLDLHGGYERQLHRDGTAPKSRDVIDERNSLLTFHLSISILYFSATQFLLYSHLPLSGCRPYPWRRGRAP